MNLRYLSICRGLCSTEMSSRARDMFHQEPQRSTKPLITGGKSGSSKLWRYKGLVILCFHLLEWSKNDSFFASSEPQVLSCSAEPKEDVV